MNGQVSKAIKDLDQVMQDLNNLSLSEIQEMIRYYNMQLHNFGSDTHYRFLCHNCILPMLRKLRKQYK